MNVKSIINWQRRIKDCSPPAQGDIDALKLRLRRGYYLIYTLFALVAVAAIAAGAVVGIAVDPGAGVVTVIVAVIAGAAAGVIVAVIAADGVIDGVVVAIAAGVVAIAAGVVAIAAIAAAGAGAGDIAGVVIAAVGAGAAAAAGAATFNCINNTHLEIDNTTDTLVTLRRLVKKEPEIKAYTHKLSEMDREITNVEMNELKRFCESKETMISELKLKQEIYGKGEV